MITYLYNFFYYFISFIIALFLILLGIIGMILPWSSTMRSDLVSMILENSLAISLIGFAIFGIGLILFMYLWSSSKRRYYHIKVDNQIAKVDETIIQHYLDVYWKQLYPTRDIPNRMILKKNKIKIIADLPYEPIEERKLFIQKVQTELQDIFKRILGYSQDFVLSISFQSMKP